MNLAAVTACAARAGEVLIPIAKELNKHLKIAPNELPLDFLANAFDVNTRVAITFGASLGSAIVGATFLLSHVSINPITIAKGVVGAVGWELAAVGVYYLAYNVL